MSPRLDQTTITLSRVSSTTLDINVLSILPSSLNPDITSNANLVFTKFKSTTDVFVVTNSSASEPVNDQSIPAFLNTRSAGKGKDQSMRKARSVSRASMNADVIPKNRSASPPHCLIWRH
mmetsp:Transcript_6782/g.10595  ORF Transcript_6782/g.10595 Transcript_6782/m.10595 type:complete len:120 (+) Transcript_6782:796-1155(+)